MLFKFFILCLLCGLPAYSVSQTIDSDTTSDTISSTTTSSSTSTISDTTLTTSSDSNLITSLNFNSTTLTAENTTSINQNETTTSILNTVDSTSTIISTLTPSNETINNITITTATTTTLIIQTSTIENNTGRVVGIMVAFGVAGIIIVMGFLFYVWRKTKLEENKYITLADKLNTSSSRPPSPGANNINEDFFINNNRSDIVFTNPAFNLQERRPKTSNDDFRFDFNDIKGAGNNESNL